MEFGEKLLKLRKDRGMSQEELAEQLNTSRQAISKWENGQGFPEIEKLLVLSNVFNTPIDYLLKDSLENNQENLTGYYVSRENVEGFLTNNKKMTKYGSFGISFIIASYIPYLTFQHSFKIYSIIIASMIVLGGAAIISASFMEEQYKTLKREPLIFDKNVLNELKNKYAILRKKYNLLIVIGSCLVLAGGTIILLFEKGFGSGENLISFYSICVFMIAIGTYILIYFISIIESYELLVKNEDHINKLSYSY